MKKFFMAAVFLMLAAFAVPASAVPPVAPSLSLAEFSKMLDAAKGKVVVINVFASWCGPCRVEIPDLIRARDALPTEKVAFIGLSVDADAAAIQRFAAARHFNYPVFQDDGSIAAVMNISAIPVNFILDRKGELVLRREGVLSEEAVIALVNKALSDR